MTPLTADDVVADPAPTPDLAERAALALTMAALDPPRARALGTAVLDQARAERAWDVASAAARAVGVAALNLGDLDDAVRHLRTALKSAERAGHRERAGEARMSLASAYVVRGHPSKASREIEAAIDGLDGLQRARATVQQAAILQELGRFDDALRAARTALPVLRREGDAEWAVRALSNRSAIHAERRAFRAAEADLSEALRLCDEHGLELPAAYAEQNLGCLSALCGDVPASLRHFDGAAVRYDAHGLDEPSLFVDRARVLLSVRLLDEARATAESAVEGYGRQRRDNHLPEALMLLSTIALVQGDTSTALSTAESAERAFRRLGRASSVALARYAHIQAALADDPQSVAPARLARTARQLEEAGWTVPALEALVLAGRIALDQGRSETARKYLTTASRARRTGPADVRARAWLAEAMLRRADGRRAGAVSALRAGVRIVDEHQATLGATELRAHVSAHRGALARAGLRMALEDRDARRVLWWAERDRATALRMRSPLPPDDADLNRDLAELRSTMTQIEELRDEGVEDAPLVHRQVALERRIRDRCRTLEGGSAAARGRDVLDDLPGPLGEAALVEFAEIDGSLHAVTVSGGRCGMHALGDVEQVRRALELVPFALHRMARARDGSAARVAAAAAVLLEATGRLDELLMRPLLNHVGDRPLVVVPTGSLHSVPWSALPSCVGRPVTVSPSATLWHTAVTRERRDPDGAVVSVAGPGLPGAATEAREVASLYDGSVLLVDEAATATAVLGSMDGAEQLHLAAHGRVRSDNPLFSSLRLADGPLTVYELEQLDKAPRRVTLSACDTGRAHTVAGTEVLGFGAALLSAGTQTLVAPVVPVPDAATVPLMLGYHQALRGGLAPAAALATAQAGIDKSDRVAAAAAAGFVCLGAG